VDVENWAVLVENYFEGAGRCMRSGYGENGSWIRKQIMSSYSVDCTEAL